MRRFILALVALCYLLTTAQAKHHFNIRLWRYDAEKPCHYRLRGLVTKKIRGDGHCQSFKTPMSSFEYGWLKHPVPQPIKHPQFELPVDYGWCEIHLWEDKHCQGRSLGKIENANRGKNIGLCMHDFKSEDGKPRKAMSLKLICDQRLNDTHNAIHA